MPCELGQCHGEESNWANVQAFWYAQLHVTASIFPHNKLGWLFCLTEWIQSEQYPWYQRKWWAFIISDVSATFFELFMPLKFFCDNM